MNAPTWPSGLRADLPHSADLYDRTKLHERTRR